MFLSLYYTPLSLGMHTQFHTAVPIRYVKLSNGYNMAYVDEGQGDKILLFIHGLGNYALGWKKNIEVLRHYYRCIAIDLPGNGYSDRADFSYSMHFFAGSVFDFINKLGLQNIYLAGHSMGAQIALTLTLLEPQIAHKLILCAPAGFEVFNSFEKGLYMSSLHFLDFFSTEENSLRKVIKSSFYHFPPQAQEMLAELVAIQKTYPVSAYRKMIESCIKGMLDEPVYDQLPTIQQPTLIMYGERDALIPNRLIHPVTTRHIAEQGARLLPNALLKMIPQCGHFLQMEKAELVNRYIMDFIG